MRSKSMESFASDSDTIEELVSGNVNRLTVKPLGQNLKTKRGQLIFDACFESGNLGKVEAISYYEYDLHIRADTCNPKYRVWFNFTVENSSHQQRVIFNIVNFSKTKSLYREGMSPLVRSSSRPNWIRIPNKNVFYYRCPEHKKYYVMSFAFCFDREDDVYQFCYCYPYTYARLQAYLDELEKCNYHCFKRELLGMTVQQRRVDLITITHPKNVTSNADMKRRTVFITARVHPGETPSSYVCQGFIDFMVSDHPLAQELRYHLIFKVVPMLNPDGVFLGNYRCSLLGFDLNRQWRNPSQWAHPEIHATKLLLMKLDRSTTMDVNFFVDIHAHSTMMNGFMYGNVFEDEERAERQAVFPNLLSRFAEDFSLHQTNFNRDSVKAGTGRRTLGGILDNHTLCYTLEVSFFSYTNLTTGETVPYTEARCILCKDLECAFVVCRSWRTNFSEQMHNGIVNSSYQYSETILTICFCLCYIAAPKLNSQGVKVSPSIAKNPKVKDIMAKRMTKRTENAVACYRTQSFGIEVFLMIVGRSSVKSSLEQSVIRAGIL
ncbi:unnamed protein product [Dicrocoelium dendriticum]|nr:unnamed protein product [Dicrocoelium dendriticum]